MEQAMSIPPIPPNSEFFEFAGDQRFFYWGDSEYTSMARFDPDSRDAVPPDRHRKIIASVAAEEWLTAQKELEAKLKIEDWEKGSDPYRQLKREIQKCADNRHDWRKWGKQ
jgi:hypothetical protein